MGSVVDGLLSLEGDDPTVELVAIYEMQKFEEIKC
jgi:hypothetical protein